MRHSAVFLGAVLVAALAWTLVDAASSRGDTAGVGLDANTMKAALHTATAEEQGFIDRVLAKVAKGTLPANIVQSTFLWARKKTRYQFQYFKYALTLRASELGVQLN